MVTPSPTELAPGLFALSHSYPVDGRVSWHPPTVRGWAPANCYLFKEGSTALLVDTGLTIHTSAIINQLRGLLADVDKLDVLVLRMGEFDSMCGLVDILHEFRVGTVYGQYDGGAAWGDFHPNKRLSDVAHAAQVKEDVVSKVLDYSVGDRKLHIFRPELRLLSTHWIFDESSRTLITSDSFAYAINPSESGPWVINGTELADTVTVEQVCDHLLNTRFWWLAGSQTEELRRELADIAARFDIERLAPAFGCILSGTDVVARHFRLMDAAMQKANAREKETVA